ncbi:MAG TPA: DUF2442 domain-containing protein [Rubrobacter sp.]|nr:DUF2442 domain-containing protein [Rubrobacter sp.]
MLASEGNELITEVRFTDDDLVVALADGRTLSVPMVWYPSLFNASEEERNDWRLIGDGEGIHWPQIDEDLSAEGLLRGIPSSTVRPRSTRANEPREQSLFLYAGEYDSVDDAKADLEVLKELHREHRVGTYDAAVLTKNEEGKVEIVDKIEEPTQHGGWAGLAVGAAIGMIFPPSVLVSGLVGAGAGALIGHLEGWMSRSDLKEIGEVLAESEAALIVVGEATIERAVEEATKRAKKEMKKEVRAVAKDMQRR